MNYLRIARVGLTMVELLVALSISTIVLLGVVSLLGLSGRAVPQPDGIQETTVRMADFLARLSDDLACAVKITRAEPRAITLVVPDRTGDGLEESISYSWSGVAGEPILREVNGTWISELSDAVGVLEFTYTRGPRDVRLLQKKTMGASRVLQSDLFPAPTGETLRSNAVGTIVLEVPLSSSEVAWVLESLTLYFQQSGSDDDAARVEIRGCDEDGDPTDTLYATVTIRESDMTEVLNPHTMRFPGIVVPAGVRLCVVVTCLEGDSGNGKIGVGTAGALAALGGASALANPMSFEMVGTITSVTGGLSSRTAVTSVLVRLRTEGEIWKTQVNLPIVNPASIPSS